MALVETRDENSDDVIWGAAAIGDAVGKNERQAYYLLEKGHLPARKVGAQWAASRKKLLSYITGDDESGA